MKRQIPFVLLISAFLLTVVSTAAGLIITVDNDGPADFDNIQAAIDTAANGDTVIVADGTYTGSGNRDIQLTGKIITVRSQNGPENCTIDCNGTQTEPHRGLNFINNQDGNSILDGFTITNGYGPFEYTAGKWNFVGGAIYCDESEPTIKNCIFKNNFASAHGGGIYNVGGNPKISHCTFEHNSASRGGGIYNTSGSPVVSDCLFSMNSASHGGGMYNFARNPKVFDCTFVDNSAINGGGIFSYFYTFLEVRNCDFSRNFASDTGGGICNNTCVSLMISNSSFNGNSATRQGGGIMNLGSYLTANNCSFSNNSSSSTGGGLFIYGNMGLPSTLNGCAFINNSASRGGGGIKKSSTDIILRNCLLRGNTAPSGGGISSNKKNLRIISSVIWSNSVDQIKDYPSSNVSYSNVQGGWPGDGNIDADPLFVAPDSDDYHLLPGSPCIDAGDPNYEAEPDETDLDGRPRVIGGRIDMGAFEADYIKVPVKFTPQALNPRSKGNWVKAHFVLPEDFDVNDVDANTPAVIAAFGVESEYMNVFINGDGFVEVEVAFSRAAFCGAATGNEPVEVTVIGQLTTGQQFYGTDTIRIINNNLEYLTVLSSHWLRTDCGNPDWCDGLDLDQDSVVNFTDFALLDGCCIEVINQ